MRLLLDTHTFIWWDSDPAKHSQANVENVCLISKDQKIAQYSLQLIW